MATKEKIPSTQQPDQADAAAQDSSVAATSTATPTPQEAKPQSNKPFRDQDPFDNYLETAYRRSVMHDLGMCVERMGADAIQVTLPIQEKLHQYSGVVHGGILLLLAESAASILTCLHLDLRTHCALGMQVSANHIRPARTGVLKAVPRMLHQGRSTCVCDVSIVDEQDKMVSSARVTLLLRPQTQSGQYEADCQGTRWSKQAETIHLTSPRDNRRGRPFARHDRDRQDRQQRHPQRWHADRRDERDDRPRRRGDRFDDSRDRQERRFHTRDEHRTGANRGESNPRRRGDRFDSRDHQARDSHARNRNERGADRRRPERSNSSRGNRSDRRDKR